MIHGWAIWEHPNIMLEAEFHGIWKSPNGHFLDVTPYSFNFNRILFMPEENLKHDFTNPDKTICNKRFPLTNHRSIKPLFETLNKIYEQREK